MSVSRASLLPLHGWTVLSLRPRGQHAALRRAAARLGARVLAVSPVALVLPDDAATRAALTAALQADIVIATSPNAVRAAARLHPLAARPGQPWLAVGSSTRRALQRHGIAASAPTRMDSEGLLALPALAAVAGQRIGLITAPGGRDLLAPTLTARGAQVLRAEVYARVEVPIPTRQRQALAVALQTPQQVLLALTSGEALAALQTQLADPTLYAVGVVASSPRLEAQARAAGFTRIVTAAGPRPAQLLAAATQLADR
ncbi:uroporphyrinogen-III synthase [Thermomonas hydrothermalis]|uniref:Uroporphyrinogen-III synthase n=1 Tax=Thermomonas hydrothermalis TaxID=213588 RepID=A0A1M4YJV3_9GAMM|nr:uroporphyrinogen-III synthase [Thermomonas hydrothermalis]MCL6619133.1 uroporphyrinogen-III synthase [Thermomonas hydrothermalis]SHF06135.1 uroporphyrinogen-III synthase [Thermomonas hydrothermalis]